MSDDELKAAERLCPSCGAEQVLWHCGECQKREAMAASRATEQNILIAATAYVHARRAYADVQRNLGAIAASRQLTELYKALDAAVDQEQSKEKA